MLSCVLKLLPEHSGKYGFQDDRLNMLKKAKKRIHADNETYYDSCAHLEYKHNFCMVLLFQFWLLVLWKIRDVCKIL